MSISTTEPPTDRCRPFPNPPDAPFRCFGLTDTGSLRTSNQDCFGFDPARALYVVADGVGGAVHGEVASRAAVDEILAAMAGPETDADDDPSRAAEPLVRAILQAQLQLKVASGEDPALRGMSTTVVALHLCAPDRGVVAHLGDSRAYRLREGALEQLTVDHTLEQEMRKWDLPVKRGADREVPAANVLTRSLNTSEPPQVETTPVEVLPGDLFLLCSDGLTKMLDESEILECLLDAWPHDRLPGIEERCRRLLERSVGNGGYDNVTVVLIEVPEAPA